MRLRLGNRLTGWARARRLAAAGLAGVAGLVALAATSYSQQTSVGVLKVRVGGDSHQTRLVIELDRPTRGTLVSPATPSGEVHLALAKLDVPGDMQGEGAGLAVSMRARSCAWPRRRRRSRR